MYRLALGFRSASKDVCYLWYKTLFRPILEVLVLWMMEVADRTYDTVAGLGMGEGRETWAVVGITT